MKYLLIIILLINNINVFTQNVSVNKEEQKQFMNSQVDDFTVIANNYLSTKNSFDVLTPYFLTEEDIQYWISQFEFTEETLKQITREEFYNKIHSWVVAAKTELKAALIDIDAVQFVKSNIKIAEDPKIKVDKSANVDLYLLKDGHPISTLMLTFIDIEGKLKLIKVN